MPNKLLKFEIFSTIMIMILGTILHFTFSFFHQNLFVALFSPVNESIWEHLKLLYFPSLIFIIIGSFLFLAKYPNYLQVKIKYLLLSLLFIITFFYTYTGIIGYHLAILDILSFYVAVFFEQYFSYHNCSLGTKKILEPLFILFILTYSFAYYTFKPLPIPLFEDPLTNTYGLK